MAYYTVEELANAPIRSFIRYEGSDGNYTALKLDSMVLQVKNNGHYQRVGYNSLEEWVATLPEGAADKLTLQTDENYQRHGTRKVPQKRVPVVKKHTYESDIKLLSEIVERLRMY